MSGAIDNIQSTFGKPILSRILLDVSRMQQGPTV